MRRALSLVALMAAASPAAAAVDEQTVAAFRARPALVMIGVAVGAAGQVGCGGGAPVSASPAPFTWIGSGSIIHPEGWVVTNGHVVSPYVEENEGKYLPTLLERAVAQACRSALEGLPGEARAARLRALAADPATRGGLRLEKKLQVTMANGKIYPAQVRTYSPPAFVVVGTTKDPSGAERKEYGKDVAILKFEARDLPVVRLAKSIKQVYIGQEILVVGFPGVVADHELLSQATRFSPSVTFGRVSGRKRDVGGQEVIQTDAAIIQGNSGGPVLNREGEVIGAATFVSFQGDQIIQGFNFLIPVETLWEAAQKAGVTPQPDSAFMRQWDQAIALYQKGSYRRAVERVQAAGALHPGFLEVERVKEAVEAHLAEQPFFERDAVRWVLAAVGLVAAASIVWGGGRWASTALTRRIQRVVQEELRTPGARG